MPNNIKRLVAKLKNQDSIIRLDAIEELGNLKDHRLFDIFLKVYENKEEMAGIREAARDAIWKFDPKWLPNIQGVEILEKFISKLISLYDKTPNGEGFRAHSTSARPVEKLGEKLNEKGGINLMVLAHGLFKLHRPKAARNLEFVWDGVGYWQG